MLLPVDCQMVAMQSANVGSTAHDDCQTRAAILKLGSSPYLLHAPSKPEPSGCTEAIKTFPYQRSSSRMYGKLITVAILRSLHHLIRKKNEQQKKVRIVSGAGTGIRNMSCAVNDLLDNI